MRHASGQTAALPAYAVANPAQQLSDTRSMLALVLGVAGIAGSIFIPVVGLMFGLLAAIAGTSARAVNRSGLKKAGLVFSALALLSGLAMWTYNIQHDPRFNDKTVRAAPKGRGVSAASSLSTPCYSLNFVDQLNVDNKSGSCNLSAFNGASLETSTNAYKIYASKSNIADVNTFTTTAKAAIEKDVRDNMKGFTISSQQVGSFAGSPAYIVNVYDKQSNVAIVEAAVLRKVSNGYNVFVMIHANQGPEANVQILESQWQWK